MLAREYYSEQRRILRASLLFALTYVLSSTLAYAWLDLTYPENDKLEPLVVFLDSAFGYVLLVVFMRRSGYLANGKRGGVVKWVLVGTATGLLTLLGLVIFILPGIYLLARFAPALAMVLVSGKGPFDALGSAWKMTADHSLSVAISISGALICFGLAIAIVVLAETSAVHDWRTLNVVSDIIAALGTVWLTIAGIAAYGVLERSKSTPA